MRNGLVREQRPSVGMLIAFRRRTWMWQKLLTASIRYSLSLRVIRGPRYGMPVEMTSVGICVSSQSKVSQNQERNESKVTDSCKQQTNSIYRTKISWI